MGTTQRKTYWGQSGGSAGGTGARVGAEGATVPTPTGGVSRPMTPASRPMTPATPTQTSRPPSRRSQASPPFGAARALERIRLAEGSAQQEMFGDFADMYALFVTTDRLERLWRRDAITDAEYEEQCYSLIRKFEAVRSATRESIPDIDAFYAEYNINAAGGKYRLVNSKVPMTQEVKKPDDEEQVRHNIHCTQFFTALLDNIELDQKSPDSLLNLCNSLQRSLGKVRGIGHDFAFLSKLKAWIARLNSMSPTEELNDDDAARFKLDLKTGYDDYLHVKSAL